MFFFFFGLLSIVDWSRFMHLSDENFTCLAAPGEWALVRLLESGNGPTSAVESRHTELALGHAATWDGRQARLISKQIKDYCKRATTSNPLQSEKLKHRNSSAGVFTPRVCPQDKNKNKNCQKTKNKRIKKKYCIKKKSVNRHLWTEHNVLTNVLDVTSFQCQLICPPNIIIINLLSLLLVAVI